MKLLNKFRKILKIIFMTSLVLSQNKLNIIEHLDFSENLKQNEIQPNILSSSYYDSYLMLDFYKQVIIKIDLSGETTFSSAIGDNSFQYGDFVWLDVMPDGIKVLDKLDNKILHLDHNLNKIQTISLSKDIYPVKASSFPWGDILLYSKTFNSIYIFINGKLDEKTFINFYKEFNTKICVEDIEINQDGEIGLLHCSGELTLFSQNGKKKITYPNLLKDAKFLVSINFEWLYFDNNGNGRFVEDKLINELIVPANPIIDVISNNGFLSFLTKDHILTMDVQQ
ncbi:MAG: hypothetical protein HOI03_01780 [Candidatus Marinimicrobia bacterium]|nr:hypothetical protein [Candidatus Neomarinimicrobiota bacterium]